MWLSEKTIEKRENRQGVLTVGSVSIGGAKPSVVLDGEQSGAMLLGGAAYAPKVGDEVLVARDGEGRSFVLGPVFKNVSGSVGKGEVYITNGASGVIRLREDGVIELSGNVLLTGRTEIEGQLLINGLPYAAPAASSGGTGDGA